MTSRVCNKHGVPEFCPDGVCRWCEPETVHGPEMTLLDYARNLGGPPLPFLVDLPYGESPGARALPDAAELTKLASVKVYRCACRRFAMAGSWVDHEHSDGTQHRLTRCDGSPP